MTASERLAEIKANLSEIYDTWGLGDEVLLGSRSEIAELSDTAAALVAALESVVEVHRRGHPVVSRDDMCLHCRDEFGALVPYPCPTVQAVSEALGVDRG